MHSRKHICTRPRLVFSGRSEGGAEPRTRQVRGMMDNERRYGIISIHGPYVRQAGKLLPRVFWCLLISSTCQTCFVWLTRITPKGGWTASSIETWSPGTKSRFAILDTSDIPDSGQVGIRRLWQALFLEIVDVSLEVGTYNGIRTG